MDRRFSMRLPLAIPVMAVAALCCVAASANNEAIAQNQPAPTVVHVGLVPGDDVTQILYATQAGLFAKAGLDVRLGTLSSGTAVTEGVVGGAYDIGNGSLVSLLNAHLRGVPIYLLAAGAIYESASPEVEFVVAADSKVTTAKDLDGAIVGVPALNDLNQVAINGWVDGNGGDSQTLHYVEIPNAAAAAALAQHRIDGYVMYYPPLAEALKSKQVRILAPADDSIGHYFVLTGFFATKTWADAHPDAARKFTRVIYEAARYTNKHHRETAPILASMTKIPLQTIEEMHRVDEATSLNPADVQPLIDAAARYHMIKSAFSAKDVIWSSR